MTSKVVYGKVEPVEVLWTSLSRSKFGHLSGYAERRNETGAVSTWQSNFRADMLRLNLTYCKHSAAYRSKRDLTFTTVIASYFG